MRHYRFEPDDQQQAIVEALSAAIGAEKPPSPLTSGAASAHAFDREAWQALTEFGLFRLLAPEDRAGLGLDLVSGVYCAEVLGSALVAVPAIEQLLAVPVLLAMGHRDHANAAMEGTALVTIGFGRETVGHVPFGGDAAMAIVADQTCGLALVRATGWTAHAEASIDPSQPLHALRLRERPSFGAIDRFGVVRASLLVLYAAHALGVGSAALNATRDYLSTRRQFGQPLAHFQAVRHDLANALAAIESLRALVLAAAHAIVDHAPDAQRLAMLAKARVSERMHDGLRSAVVLHGGIGFSAEHFIHRYLLRAMHCRSLLGSPRRLYREAG